jgi:hypothetical protein
MFDARTAGDFPTRRRKERPSSLPLQVERDGIGEIIELAPKDHPGILLLPLLEPASMLVGKTSTAGVNVCGYEAIYFGKNPADVAKHLCTKTMTVTANWNVTAFARMLAKIAHSYAVSIVGALPRESVPVLPLILGEADDASSWLGSAPFKLAIEEKKPTHALGVAWVPDPNTAGDELLLVRVKLFVPSGATGYEIIVSRKNVGET